MYIRISSSNPHLLSVINKNPKTDNGLYLKPLKNGHVVGNVIDANNYEILFQDTRHSYSSYDDNSMDYLSYCSPAVVMDCVSGLFGHLLKDKHDVASTIIPWLDTTISEVDNDPVLIEVKNFQISSSWYRNGRFLLSRYVPGISVEPAEGTPEIFKLTIVSDCISAGLNLLMLASFLTCMSNNYDFYLDNERVIKYATILTNVSPPYFFWYLFIKRCVIRSHSLAEKVLPILQEAYQRDTGVPVSFTRFDTHTDRINWCENNIDITQPVINFGCGEFRLEKRMLKKNPIKWVSYDIDDYSELRDKIANNLPNTDDWTFEKGITAVKRTKGIKGGTIVCSEVIEHTDLTKIARTIKSLADYTKAGKILITTPNVDFNKFYNLEQGELRREDHIKELTPDEFADWCYETFPDAEIEFQEIGDVVGEDFVTSGAIIKL